jgi:hypothetical protein
LYDIIFESSPDQTLNRIHGIGRIGDGLTLGCLTYQHLTIFAECNDRGCGPVPLAVLDHAGLIPFHDRDARVRGTKVDTNNFTHDFCSPIGSNSKLVCRWGRQ